MYDAGVTGPGVSLCMGLVAQETLASVLLGSDFGSRCMYRRCCVSLCILVKAMTALLNTLAVMCTSVS